jgi:hypothetical protein
VDKGIKDGVMAEFKRLQAVGLDAYCLVQQGASRLA